MVNKRRTFQCAGEHRVTEQPTVRELEAPDAWAYRPGERIYYCVLQMGHDGDEHVDSKGRRWTQLLIAKIGGWATADARRKQPLRKEQ